MIRFNVPYLTGKEEQYIRDALAKRELSGNGWYTKACTKLLESRYGHSCFLSNSGTDSLEMAGLLANIEAGSEVIMPSYTFVSTANAFMLLGAKIRFVDSMIGHPNMDVSLIEEVLTPNTKAIVVMHYGGVACEMDKVLELAAKHDLLVIEDAAHCIDAMYNGKLLGTIGGLGAFSFHSTKNISSGEGGMLVVNDDQLVKRAEVVWEKGTNRSAFFRGEIDKYGWVDIGSSYLPSELMAAFLLAQLEEVDNIQARRVQIWEQYHERFSELAEFGYQVPSIPSYATNNAHMYYLVCPSLSDRQGLIRHLADHGVKAVFHYQSLHRSDYYASIEPVEAKRDLPNSDRYSDQLVRLPLFPDLSDQQVELIAGLVIDFVKR